ncbi:hypothetical protein EUGRSUZ_H04584 [Eucalyptus grandis]|uniref:Uncharacterized protein n=2 Tax=Eucalyptus grandis TaxID=71139 RepID=A0ACC3JYV5_EUCGR|nr:hypothetical protein EUGRSUZ_H04584 [Eucalyptus grandis]
MEKFKTLEIVRASPGSAVFHLRLNRPSSRNALSLDSFTELPLALSSLDRNPDALVLVLSGAGHHFCSGIELAALDSSPPPGDRGRAGERLRRHIKYLQDAVTAIERCRKPVIAAVHGACVGGGVDVATACDVRYCTEDAFFSVKEVDLAITADLGTLQRLPSIVGYGNAMELALTGRRVSGSEAKELGLVSRVFGSKRELDDGVRVIAEGWFYFAHSNCFQVPDGCYRDQSCVAEEQGHEHRSRFGLCRDLELGNAFV